MDLRCTTEAYDTLYARWLSNPGRLLDVAEYEPGQKVLDLCGGSGAVSKECLERGARPQDVTLLDLKPRFGVVRTVEADADYPPPTEDHYDLVVMRQAGGYLAWTDAMLSWIAGRLPKTGVFVFNYFNKPKRRVKTYKYGGRRFVEASWYWNADVWHMQWCVGVGVDFTRFKWYSTDHLRRYIERFFTVAVLSEGATQTWVCKPR